MTKFTTYRDSFPNARLTRSESGALEVVLHTDGGSLIFNGHTHEQFVDLFHAIGSDPDNRGSRSRVDRHRRRFTDFSPWMNLGAASLGRMSLGIGAMSASFPMTIPTATIGWPAKRC
jgi:hypothetical protein